MKKFWLGLMALGVTLSALMIGADVEAAKKVVAVTDVSCVMNDNVSRLAAHEFAVHLETVIQNSGTYTVVERTRLSSVMRELGFQQSGSVSDQSSVSIGKMTGADYTVMGSVVDANVAAQDNVLYKSVKAKAQFNYKIIDNTTGEVKVAEMVTGSSSMPLSDKVRVNSDQVRMLLSRAVAEAAEKVALKFADMNPLAGSVMKFIEDKAYVNLGTEQGVKVGDLYQIYREGEILTDPMGNIIGVVEEDVAVGKVVDVKPNYCVIQTKKVKEVVPNKCKARRLVKKK